MVLYFLRCATLHYPTAKYSNCTINLPNTLGQALLVPTKISDFVNTCI